MLSTSSVKRTLSRLKSALGSLSTQTDRYEQGATGATGSTKELRDRRVAGAEAHRDGNAKIVKALAQGADTVKSGRARWQKGFGALQKSMAGSSKAVAAASSGVDKAVAANGELFRQGFEVMDAHVGTCRDLTQERYGTLTKCLSDEQEARDELGADAGEVSKSSSASVESLGQMAHLTAEAARETGRVRARKLNRAACSSLPADPSPETERLLRTANALAESPRSRLNLAIALLQSGRAEESLKVLALQQDGEQAGAPAAVVSALAHLQAGDPLAAQGAIEPALASEPDSGLAKAVAGLVQLANGRSALGVRNLSAACTDKPSLFTSAATFARHIGKAIR